MDADNQGTDKKMDNTSNASKSASDAAYEKAKTKVGKGVATAAGAIDGVTEKMDEHDLSNKASGAIRKTGEATRQVAGTAAEEFHRTKEHISNAKDTTLDE